jgi:putative acetyltransferase
MPVSAYGIRPGSEGPAEHLMAPVLDGSSSVAPGTIRYPAAFGT